MKTVLVVALAGLLIVSTAVAVSYARNGGYWGGGSGPGWMNYGVSWTDYGTAPAGSNPGAYSLGCPAGYGFGRGMQGLWGRGRGQGMGYGRRW